MKCPPGIKLPKGMNCVKLLKAIYGLKQAGRCWHKLFKKVLEEEGFTAIDEDICLYVHHGPNGQVTFMCVFVDDCFGVSTESKFLDKVKARLAREFELQESDDLNYVLGVEIERDPKTGSIKLTHRKYIRDMLKRFNMESCHTVRMPADPQVHLIAEDESAELDADVPYRQAVGALLWTSVCVRPEIAYAVNRVAKFVEKPRQSHWTAVKRIFRYLKGTVDKGIQYVGSGSGQPNLLAYSDTDYAEDKDTRKSTTGYVVMLSGGPVAWRSTQQKGTALSTQVAELYALTDATVQTIWQRNLLASMGYKQSLPTTVMEDNQAAIDVCSNEIINRRVKCVGVRLGFLRDHLADEVIKLQYVPSEENTADIFIKALPAPAFVKHSNSLVVD